MKSSLFIAATLIAAPLGHQALAGYSFSSVIDPSGTNGTIVNGINNSGVLVGTYSNSSSHGFTDTAGSFNNFDVTGSSATFGQGISANNTVIGYYTDPSGDHGYTGPAATPVSFDAPFAGATGATFGLGINQSGAATVGTFFDASSTPQGFLNSGGFTQISAPTAASTVTTGVNNAGTSVGYFVDGSGNTHGFIRTAAGAFSVIDDPSATIGTFVTGINNLGQLTGYYVDGSGTHGFVMTGSDFVTIDAPDASNFTEVTGINDSGEIVGYAVDAASGLDQGFTASAAIPEPATISVLGFGAFTLLMRRRRRAA